MLKEMYSNSTAGRWALYFFAASFVFLLVHYFWFRPPPLNDLTVIRGTVVSAKYLDQSFQGWSNYSLEVQDDKGAKMLLAYFDDTGDTSVAEGNRSNFKQAFENLRGKKLVAWVDMKIGMNPIYQLTIEGENFVDYKTRTAQLMGQPVYAALCFAVFLILSVRRYLLISHNRRYLMSRHSLKEEIK